MDLVYEVRKIDNKKGRGLFATRDINEGECIFSEKPLVSVQFAWNRKCKYLACQHCLKPLETPQQAYQRLSRDEETVLPPINNELSVPTIVNCQQCNEEYCSEECMTQAFNTYHQTLCTKGDPAHPLNNLIETWKTIHYPPETTNVMLIARLISQAIQHDSASEVNEIVSSFDLDPINEESGLAHKLLKDDFKEKIEVIRKMFKDFFFYPPLEHWYTPEGFRSLLALIGKNGQGIGTNAFNEWALRAEEEGNRLDELYDKIEYESGDFEDCEGSGLFKLQSSCNHSCEPNAQVSFPCNTYDLCLKALKHIKKNEEISISYLQNCELGRSRHSRQKTLRENYLFLCDCYKCVLQADQADVTSEDDEDEEDEMDTD